MRKICVFTSTRADYGLLRWTLQELRQAPDVQLQILCSGTHLSGHFGNTYQAIEADGFEISYRCEMLVSGDSPMAVGKSMGLALMGYCQALQQLTPDLLVILGDRYEALAAGTAATLFQIPIAHLHGGELTQGAIDEAFRHSLTKMSHLHFCSSAQSAKRIQQLGETPQRVFQVGALGIEGIRRIDYMKQEELEELVGMSLKAPTWLVTYHPATLANVSSEKQVAEFLAALQEYPERQVVFTLPNCDTGHEAIRELIEAYVSARPSTCRSFVSLGQRRYLSLARQCQAVLGNSSSGILEAPSLGIPTLNIGERQQGRERASSVIDCDWDRVSIRAGMARLLSDEFREGLQEITTPYGDGHAAEKIVSVLRTVPLQDLTRKSFVDLPSSILGPLASDSMAQPPLTIDLHP